LPVANVHPFRTGEAIGNGRGAAWCATSMAEELRGAGLDHADGWPVFDLLLVGIGGDGHVLSVFPGSAAFDSSELALAIPAPTHIEPHIERVTLNPAVIAVARSVLVVSYGADKARILAEVLGPDRDPRRLPAQLAAQPDATWVLDAAAASALPR
jgi:6-phosphogluconolactonase